MVAPKLHLHLQKHALVCLSVRPSVRGVAVTGVVTASNFALLPLRSFCRSCARNRPNFIWRRSRRSVEAAYEGGRAFLCGKSAGIVTQSVTGRRGEKVGRRGYVRVRARRVL